MEKKICECLLRSICLLVGVFIVGESVWACSYEDKDDRTNIKEMCIRDSYTDTRIMMLS